MTYVLLAQITGIIGWLLLVYSYYKDEIDSLLFIQIISSLFYCLNYFFLGAYAGLIVCFFELVKEYLYYKTDKDDYIFLFTLPVYILIGFVSYDGVISLLPIIGSIIDGATLTKNRNMAVLGGVISNILWVIYDIFILSYACALTDGILVISNISLLIFGYSRIVKISKFKVYKCNYFSNKIGKEILKLDKNQYGEEYTWDTNYQKEVFNKNKDSIILIKYKNDIVGYINYLVINEDTYNHIKNSKKMTYDYDINSISNFKKNNYLVIDSINLEKKYQNFEAIKLIKKRIVRLIRNKYIHGFKINGIISTSVDTFEKEVLENLSFNKIKEFDSNTTLYELDKNVIEEIYIKDYIKKEKQKKKFKVIRNEKITDEILNEIKTVDEIFYKKEYIWDTNYQKEIFNKNKYSMICIMYDKKLIGYINYFPIVKEIYENIKEFDKTIDNYEINDISKYYKTKPNYITINSIVISPKFQNGYAIILINKALKKELKKLNDNGFKIKGITATSISKDGRKYLEELGFTKYKKLNDNNNLYILEDNDLNIFLH